VTAPFMASHLFSFLLKLLPLCGREYFLKLFVRLPADVVDSWFGFLAQGLELLARVAQDLMDLGFLLGTQL
jgi:hypothetical protein